MGGREIDCSRVMVLLAVVTLLIRVRSTPIRLADLLAGRVEMRNPTKCVTRLRSRLDAPCKQDG